MNTFKDNIIQKIKNGDVGMIPRWRFVLQSSLMLAGLVVVALVTIYLASFLVFVFHKTGIWATPFFGMEGVFFLVVSSPWILILSVLTFLTLLYMLVTQYAFSYQKPLVYSLVTVVLMVVGISSYIQHIALHDRIGAYVERRNVPGAAPLYRSVADGKPKEILFGTIVAMNDGGFTLRTDRGEELMIVVTARTKQSPRHVYVEGDPVMVFGEQKNGTITAIGIRSADRALTPSPRVEGVQFMR